MNIGVTLERFQSSRKIPASDSLNKSVNGFPSEAKHSFKTIAYILFMPTPFLVLTFGSHLNNSKNVYVRKFEISKKKYVRKITSSINFMFEKGYVQNILRSKNFMFEKLSENFENSKIEIQSSKVYILIIYIILKIFVDFRKTISNPKPSW